MYEHAFAVGYGSKTTTHIDAFMAMTNWQVPWNHLRARRNAAIPVHDLVLLHYRNPREADILVSGDTRMGLNVAHGLAPPQRRSMRPCASASPPAAINLASPFAAVSSDR